MHILVLTALTAIFTLTACESTSGSDRKVTLKRPNASVPVSAETEAPDPGALASYNIPPGRCGMVLWAKAGTDTVPVFQALQDGSAVMEIDGKMTQMVRYSAQGEARAAMPNIQRYNALLTQTDVIQVEVSTVWGNQFPGGSYVKNGTIILTGPDGWKRVMPVAGIAGCKATA